MKTGKLLTLAALLTCCFALAACNGGESSDSSSGYSSENPSSETGDSSIISSEDSSSETSSEDISSEDSSEGDISSSDDISSSEEPDSTSSEEPVESSSQEDEQANWLYRVNLSIPDGVTMYYALYEGESSKASAEDDLTDIEDFSGLYEGCMVYIKAESTLNDYGVDLSITYTESGEEPSDLDSSYLYDYLGDYYNWYYFSPTADFTITATLREKRTVTVDYGDALTSDEVYVQNTSVYPYASISSSAYIKEGVAIRIRNTTSSRIYYYVDFAGDVEDTWGSVGTSINGYTDITLLADMTVYIRASEITAVPGDEEDTGSSTEEETSATISYINNTSDIYAAVHHATSDKKLCYNTSFSCISTATVELNESIYISSVDGNLKYSVDFENDSYTDVTGTLTDGNNSSDIVVYGSCTITITAA